MLLDNVFGIHEQAVAVRARRAEVLASNLANSETPGYKARDFDFKQILRQEMSPSVRLASTQAGHIRTDQGVVSTSQMLYRNPQQPSLDGNTVEAEREQVEYSANAISYQASMRFLEGKIKGLKTAITGSNQ